MGSFLALENEHVYSLRVLFLNGTAKCKRASAPVANNSVRFLIGSEKQKQFQRMIELQEIAEVGFLSFEAKIKKKQKNQQKNITTRVQPLDFYIIERIKK